MLYSHTRFAHSTCNLRSRAVSCHVKSPQADLEAAVLDSVKDVAGRGKDGLSAAQQQQLDAAVAELEQPGKGVQSPTTRPDLLDGRWQLLYTSTPGTSSPVQRTFTGTEAFTIFQEIMLGEESDCRANTVVELGEDAGVGVLRVEAEASTDSRPRPGFTPRQGEGIFLFGKSKSDPPAEPDMRIDFQFDTAAFDIRRLPFNIPYPVPFKLLGDETKGWIDITYLSPDGTFRLTRGNKGTLFILTKSGSVVDDLLVAVRDGEEDRIMTLIEKLGKSPSAPARSDLIAGKWRLKWTKQSQDANLLQKALVKQVNNWQIFGTDEHENSTVENRVALGVGTVRAVGTCTTESDTKTAVYFEKVILETFGQEIPINSNRDAKGFVEWMYVDERIRVSKGNRGSMFIHTRE